MVSIKFTRLRPTARIPQRQTALASGFDLHASLDAPMEIGATPVLVPCGIAIAAPPGADVQVRPRSGLSAQGVLAVFGTIDADYRGELLVTLYRLPGTDSHVVRDGDRIAQLVIAELTPAHWEEVDVLEGTERGVDGHGSTGSR